jgi:MFS family permease
MSSEPTEQTSAAGSCVAAAAPLEALPSYSILTKRQNILVLCLASFAATFSPLSSFIFFPAINDLSQALHVSVGRVNLTITSYMIVAGIAPAILGELADKIGRRIVYLFMMSVYCIANIGLALQSNWTALFLLRMLQSAGSAGM